MTEIKWINRLFGKEKQDSEGLTIEKCSVLNIPCDNIRPNRARPRAEFGENELLKLAASIRKYGVIEPLIVRKADVDDIYEYELVAGERRLRAAKLLELYCVPCVVVYAGDARATEIALAENLSRSDLNMFEIAHALRNYCEDNEISQDEAAKRLFLSQSFISGKLRLLKLGYEEQRAIVELSLTEEHARALLRLESSGERMSVIRRIADEELTPHETEEYIDRLLGADKSEDIEEALLGASKSVGVAVRAIAKRLDALKGAGKDVQTEIKTPSGYIELRIRIEK